MRSRRRSKKLVQTNSDAMITRLLDTNIVSYMLRNHSLYATYRPHLDGYEHAVSFQTVGELLYGGALANWNDARWARLEEVLAPMNILHSDLNVCERWAEVRVVRRSQLIGLQDCWIAATALSFGLELVTHNPRDFANIPGLAIITEAP